MHIACQIQEIPLASEEASKDVLQNLSTIVSKH